MLAASRAPTSVLRSVSRIGYTTPASASASASLRSLGALTPARSFHAQQHPSIVTPVNNVSVLRNSSGLSVQIDAVQVNRKVRRDFHCAARRLRSRGFESKLETLSPNSCRLTTAVPARGFHSSFSGGIEGILRLVGIAALGIVGLYIVWSIIKALFHIGFYLFIGVAAFWIARRIRHHRFNQMWNRIGQWNHASSNRTSTLFPPRSFKEWQKAAEALKKGSEIAYKAPEAAESGQFVHPALRFLGPYSSTLGNWLGTASTWIFNNLESQTVLAEVLSKRVLPSLARNPTLERYLGNDLQIELINNVQTRSTSYPGNTLSSVYVDFTVTGQANSARVNLEAFSKRQVDKIDWAKFQDYGFEISNIEVTLPNGKTLVVPPNSGRIVDVTID